MSGQELLPLLACRKGWGLAGDFKNCFSGWVIILNDQVGNAGRMVLVADTREACEPQARAFLDGKADI